ncbi:hypothetical protein IFM89_027640 [Coptis chinensis]|uniref:Uncharacterized protein n=1 Tax=Coptis chinensis TaxID=261450 RepID=A0A835IYP8_9MAGN|nr:hypothetical protein IFM89_027640 [Coptis chinensis]
MFLNLHTPLQEIGMPMRMLQQTGTPPSNLSSSVVSAGLLQILGKDLAELPLVAANSDYQGQPVKNATPNGLL